MVVRRRRSTAGSRSRAGRVSVLDVAARRRGPVLLGPRPSGAAHTACRDERGTRRGASRSWKRGPVASAPVAASRRSEPIRARDEASLGQFRLPGSSKQRNGQPQTQPEKRRRADPERVPTYRRLIELEHDLMISRGHAERHCAAHGHGSDGNFLPVDCGPPTRVIEGMGLDFGVGCRTDLPLLTRRVDLDLARLDCSAARRQPLRRIRRACFHPTRLVFLTRRRVEPLLRDRRRLVVLLVEREITLRLGVREVEDDERGDDGDSGPMPRGVRTRARRGSAAEAPATAAPSRDRRSTGVSRLAPR